MIKAQISVRMISSGLSDVEIASVYSEKIVRSDGSWRAPEIDFLYETKARKVVVDFKFDALYM